LDEFKAWAAQRDGIQGAALVGSFARGNFHSGSDVDLVIIVDDQAAILSAVRNEFNYGEITRWALEEWGILTSLRAYYTNGLEVEYGVVTSVWCSEPLDGGTKQVVANGFKVILDKGAVFEPVEVWLKGESPA